MSNLKVTVFLILSVAPIANLHAQQLNLAESLTPGNHSRLFAPKAKNYFLVYVPTDYTPSRRWPIIFNYHGYWASAFGKGANTAPFIQVTGGKGFIIIGMNYANSKSWASNLCNHGRPRCARIDDLGTDKMRPPGLFDIP